MARISLPAESQIKPECLDAWVKEFWCGCVYSCMSEDFLYFCDEHGPKTKRRTK